MDRLLCASSSSTAIMDQRAIVRRAHRVPINDNPPSKHRHHYHRYNTHPLIPCTFDQLPIDPKPFYEKCRRSFSSGDDFLRRKSSADMHDRRRKSTSNSSSSYSSRYRFAGEESSAPFIDWFSETDAAFVPSDRQEEAAGSNPRLRLILAPSDQNHRPTHLRSSSTRSRNQVVVLRVSVHCKGCEAKLSKHLSKMEGVTSFSIDVPTKKVTVVGDVTPLGVLASVSKVKNAQLWHPPTSTSSSSPSPSSRWST